MAVAGGCEGSEPSIRVGPVSFAEDELTGITARRRRTLAGITALGLAVARGEVDRLGEPLVERRIRQALVGQLGSELVLREAGVAEVGASVGDPDEALRAWADSALPDLAVRTDAVERRVREDVPDTTVLASWPDGTYTAEELEALLPTLERDRWQRARRNAEALAEVVEEGARESRLVARARAMGVRLPAEVEEGIRTGWRDRATRWGYTLGFREGMGNTTLKEQALEALGSTRQNTVLVRDELRERVPLLLAAYPVEIAGQDGARPTTGSDLP